jgi:hypothetical protein
VDQIQDKLTGIDCRDPPHCIDSWTKQEVPAMDSFACPCLNVKIVVTNSSSVRSGGDKIVKEDIVYPPGTDSKITVVSEAT